jgi:hypothetical protein
MRRIFGDGWLSVNLLGFENLIGFYIFMTCAWRIAESLSQYLRVQSKNE